MNKSLSEIRRILLVDDDPTVREGLRINVDFASLSPVEEVGPQLGNLDNFLANRLQADAAISDYHLTPSGYASFNGAQLVERLYRANFPALLCTRFDKTQVERIRPHRRWIPVLMAADELTPDSLMHGLEECLFEVNGNFKSTRRPWRAQILFLEQDIDDRNAYFIELPGWQRDEVLRIQLKHLPNELQSLVHPEFRCFAQANLGSDNVDDLYLCEWEIP